MMSLISFHGIPCRIGIFFIGMLMCVLLCEHGIACALRWGVSLVGVILIGHCCDALNPGVPLKTSQPAEFLWILSDSIQHCCVPFIRIHILTKNQEESPLFRELYPTYNLYNSV